MATLGSSKEFVTTMRGFGAIAECVCRRHRRRSSLRRLYDLSGDLLREAEHRQLHNGLESATKEKDSSFSHCFSHIILPSFFIGAVAAWFAASGRPSLAGLLILTIGGLVIFSAVRRRRNSQSILIQILGDYPTTLMAMASSMKAGMTPLMALERAVKLLDAAHPLRREVTLMTAALRRGAPREAAVARFAERIEAPEFELFRRAFLLVLENGGRFAPTLERLALVSRERSSLIHSAAVSTQSMRMTANILIVVTPLLVCVVSLGSPDYWTVFLEHPAARILAAGGTALILSGHLILRAMSHFKP